MVPAVVKGLGASLWRAEAGPGELEEIQGGSWALGRVELQKEEQSLNLNGHTAGPQAS